MRSEIFMLQNLNCPVCAGKIERAVRQLPGVTSTKLSFATGTLAVQYNPDELSQEHIRGTVEGFDAEVSAIVPGPRTLT